jgi:Tfp pilus assembly protein PilX
LDAAVTAVLLFTLDCLVVLGLLAMALFGMHQLCERHRAWAQEWARFAPDWPNRLR